MRRIKLIIEYDGTQFSGLQSQKKGERTVQDVLQEALAQIPGAVAKITAAGRTDAGVHALAMPIHYDTEDSIPIGQIPLALNTLLPPDTRAIHAEEAAADFCARRSCHWRHYRYRILNQAMPTALDRNRVWWIPQALNPVVMRHAIEFLVGKHDFKAFAIKEERQTVREIFKVHLSIDLSRHSNHHMELGFIGSGFLRGQVRSMVGTLVEVGTGKRDSRSIAKLLEGSTRKDAGPTAPAQGLYFVEAGYTPWIE
jgi:tRNA pseudouridine38-40 synthase